MGWRELLSDWRERLNTGGYDKNRGPWDFMDSFEKIHDRARLRRRFAYHAVMLLLVAPGGLLLLRYYLPSDFSFTPFHIPILVLYCGWVWNLFHSYGLRKEELDGGEVRRRDNLSRLRRRFAPLFGFFLSFIVVIVVLFSWSSLRLGFVPPEGVILTVLMVSVLSGFLWHCCREYIRLKKKLDAAGSPDISSRNPASPIPPEDTTCAVCTTRLGLGHARQANHVREMRNRVFELGVKSPSHLTPARRCSAGM